MSEMFETAEEVKGWYFPVLDHGFVALVDYMGGDQDIVRAARMSYGAGTRRGSPDSQLIRYLLRHRHTTPFEMVELKFHVKLPIFVARQLIRHRTASVNEYSLRYSIAPLLFYKPEPQDFCHQSTSNKQGRAAGPVDPEVYAHLTSLTEELNHLTSDLYRAELEEDIAREIARRNMPVSLYTEWYWKIDLSNLFHFLGLRYHPHAQKEIRDFAYVKAGIARLVAPHAFDAWVDYRYAAVTFSRQEMEWFLHFFSTGVSSTSLLTSLGVGPRELEEFKTKTSAVVEIPDWSLSKLSAKGPDYFEERAQAAVPVIAKK